MLFLSTMTKKKKTYTSKMHCRLKANGTKHSEDRTRPRLLFSECKPFTIGHFHMDFSAVVFAVLLEMISIQQSKKRTNSKDQMHWPLFHFPLWKMCFHFSFLKLCNKRNT